jgi:succinate dehydrogenase/fumarate reductase cytochrome b subunit
MVLLLSQCSHSCHMAVVFLLVVIVLIYHMLMDISHPRIHYDSFLG